MSIEASNAENKLAFETIKRLMDYNRAPAPLDPVPQVQVPPAPLELVENPVEETLDGGKGKGLTRTGVRIFAGLIATTTIMSSLYYSFDWFSSRQPPLLAAVSSFAIVLSASLLPDISILFFKKGGAAILAGALFAILSVGTIGFSMTNTIAGLYNQRSERMAAAAVELSGRTEYEAEMRIFEERKARKEDDIASLKRGIASNQAEAEILSAIPEKTPAQYSRSNTIDLRIKADRQSLSVAESELDAIGRAIISLGKSEAAKVVERDDFFSFLGRQVGMSPETVEFVLSAFPAVFNDVLSPAMIAVILFL